MSVVTVGGAIEVSTPANGFDGERFNKADHEGRLIVFIEPEAREIDSQFGTATAASCDFVVVLDGPEAPVVYQDQLVFGAALAPSIYKGGRVVVGRLGKSKDAKPGRSRAWVLDDPTEEELAAVQAWADENLTVSNGRLVVKL